MVGAVIEFAKPVHYATKSLGIEDEREKARADKKLYGARSWTSKVHVYATEYSWTSLENELSDAAKTCVSVPATQPKGSVIC
jgi:hypothetical protein